MNDHPSRITLERLSVGDLSGTVHEVVTRHVDACAPCRLVLEELEAARTARLAAVPPEEFIDRVIERKDRETGPMRASHRWVLGTGALAAAAAMLLLIPRPGSDVRLKGVGVTLHRNREGNVQIMRADETLRAGDALRVVITQAEARPIAAWFVDARGRVDSLLPEGPQSLSAGEHALPGSAVVESPCIDSWLVVATGDAASERTEQELRKAAARGAWSWESKLPESVQIRKLRCE